MMDAKDAVATLRQYEMLDDDQVDEIAALIERQELVIKKACEYLAGFDCPATTFDTEFYEKPDRCSPQSPTTSRDIWPCKTPCNPSQIPTSISQAVQTNASIISGWRGRC